MLKFAYKKYLSSSWKLRHIPRRVPATPKIPFPPPPNPPWGQSALTTFHRLPGTETSRNFLDPCDLIAQSFVDPLDPLVWCCFGTRGAFLGKSLARFPMSPILTIFCMFLVTFPYFFRIKIIPSSLRVHFAPAQFSPPNCAFTQFLHSNPTLSRFSRRPSVQCDTIRSAKEITFPLAPALYHTQLHVFVPRNNAKINHNPAGINRNPAKKLSVNLVDACSFAPQTSSLNSLC